MIAVHNFASNIPNNIYLSIYLMMIIIILFWWDFFKPVLAEGFYLSLSDSKSPHVSRTLLTILADLNNVVTLMVSTSPLISTSSCPFLTPLGIIPCAAFTTGITVTFIYIYIYIYIYSSLSRFRYLSHFSLCFDFTQWSVGTANSSSGQFFFKWSNPG